MEVTIRNVDDAAFRALKAWAAAHGLSVGDAVTQIVRAYVRGPNSFPKTRSIVEFPSEDWGPGNDRVSDEIDAIVYGT